LSSTHNVYGSAGKVWWVTFRYVSSTLCVGGVCGSTTGAIDTAVVHHFDGITNDSTLIGINSSDNPSTMEFVPAGPSMSIMEIVNSGGMGAVQNDWSTSDGTNWVPDADSAVGWWNRSVYTNSENGFVQSMQVVQGTNKPVFIYYSWYLNTPSGQNILWTTSNLTRPSTLDPNQFSSEFNVQTLPNDSSQVDEVQQFVQSATGQGDDLFVVNDKGLIFWSSLETPAQFHLVQSPGAGSAGVRVWRGKLLVIGPTTLWSAPIPSGL
jgi:hypothetical protein